jgi:hypothetical protein
MSKLSTSCGKSKIFTIEGVEIELKSNFLNIDDLPSLMVLGEDQTNISIEEKERKGKIIVELVTRILKKSIPDASDEEIKEFGLRNIKSLMEAIVEVSGLQNVAASN